VKQPKHYTSIDDLPQYNWRMISEKNDLSYMLVDRTKMGNKNILAEAFDKIKDEYVDTFGITENYKKILDLKKDIICLQLEMAATGDRFIENHIDMANMELDNLLSTTGKMKPSETTVRLSKHMGFQVNERTISVREYAEMVDVMRNDLTSKAA
jgi:hypothetical protein|tara:strand:- start:9058 stop:9519 length:462 start_codon:yes stop_codon:yes gene_type:complete